MQTLLFFIKVTGFCAFVQRQIKRLSDKYAYLTCISSKQSDCLKEPTYFPAQSKRKHTHTTIIMKRKYKIGWALFFCSFLVNFHIIELSSKYFFIKNVSIQFWVLVELHDFCYNFPLIVGAFKTKNDLKLWRFFWRKSCKSISHYAITISPFSW